MLEIEIVTVFSYCKQCCSKYSSMCVYVCLCKYIIFRYNILGSKVYELKTL